MRLKRRIFLLSALFHLIALYWIAQVKIPMLIYPQKEKIINIIPISVPPPLLTSSSRQGVVTGQLPGKGKKVTSGSGTVGKSTPGAPGTAPPGTPVQKFTAPPLDIKKIPELSLYSENMQEFLRDFQRRRARVSAGGTGTEPGVGDGGSGAPGKGQVFFNTSDYDLAPWAKQVLLKIEKNWFIPLAGNEKIQQPVEIITVIEKGGGISSIKVKVSSCWDAFDQSAMNALLLSAPLPGLPQDFPAKSLEVCFMFMNRQPQEKEFLKFK